MTVVHSRLTWREKVVMVLQHTTPRSGTTKQIKRSDLMKIRQMAADGMSATDVMKALGYGMSDQYWYKQCRDYRIRFHSNNRIDRSHI